MPKPVKTGLKQAEDIVALAGGAFARWLRKATAEKEISVPQLAIETGLTSTAIYNILNGVTPNPRETTKEKLAKALHTKIPASVQAAAKEETEIEGVGTLADFSPYDDSELPTCAGIYVFYDIAGRPLYVGQSSNISQRVKTYKDRFWFKPPLVQSAAFVQIDEKKLRLQMEQILIKFMKNNAVLNKQHKTDMS